MLVQKKINVRHKEKRILNLFSKQKINNKMQANAELDLPLLSAILTKAISIQEDFASYVTEGFQIPPHEQAIRDRLISQIPTIKTKSYRQSLLKIVTSLSELDSFSNNLESKVDCLLQAQETQFVESYKHHIQRIKTEFDGYTRQIKELEEKIRYYENEGKMSHLVKKVFQLEQQSARLYQMLNAKDKKIKELELTLKVNESETKRLMQTVKSTAKEKSQLLWKELLAKEGSENETPSNSKEMVIFPTEPARQAHHELSYSDQPGTTLKNFIANNLSLKSVTFDVDSKIDQEKQYSLSKSKGATMADEKLYNQNIRLKARNKKLISFQAKAIGTRDEIEQFFIKCVEQLKRQIRIRKKIQYCSFEDFKKQDKLLLMIKILSNNDILAYLHERIFRKPTKTRGESPASQTLVGCSSTSTNKRLPKINFNINYENK